MFGDIIAFVLIIIGTVIGYKGHTIYKVFTKCELNEKRVVAIKLIGLFITIIGVLLVFYS